MRKSILFTPWGLMQLKELLFDLKKDELQFKSSVERTADRINSNKKQKINSNQEAGVPCAIGFSGEGLSSTFSYFVEDDSFTATDSDDDCTDVVECIPGFNL